MPWRMQASMAEQTFVVSGDSRMRLRCNPFFDYLAQCVLDALPTKSN